MFFNFYIQLQHTMSKSMTDVDMVCILLHFTCSIMKIFELFFLCCISISYITNMFFNLYMQLLIPVNLDGAHWVLARVDFRKNKVWIYNSLLTFCDDKRYKLKLKPLEVIFPRWLEYVGFYNIRPELRSEDLWKVISVKSALQQEPGTGDCGVFVLMVTMYLMFRLRLEFNVSHVKYFRKKIAVDIFNDDIIL